MRIYCCFYRINSLIFIAQSRYIRCCPWPLPDSWCTVIVSVTTKRTLRIDLRDSNLLFRHLFRHAVFCFQLGRGSSLVELFCFLGASCSGAHTIQGELSGLCWVVSRIMDYSGSVTLLLPLSLLKFLFSLCQINWLPRLHALISA